LLFFFVFFVLFVVHGTGKIMRVRLLAAVSLWCWAVSPVQAQLPVPRLNSIFPCGARQGTTVECVVSGADLNGATGLYFSHAGITAQPAGVNKFRVTVGKNVPVGQYDVRVVAPLGVSNFRAFVVSDWPEIVETEPNNERDKAQRVKLPVVVNGRIDGVTDVDHYVFTARKGQRILINSWAWRIDSQLDATLLLYDAQGKELAYSGDYYGKDPFIDFTAPADGDYTVKIWDFVYGGGPTFFYRLHIGSLPHIDAVIPAAVVPGKKNTVTIYGRNLPGGKPAPREMQIQGKPLEMITREIQGPTDAVQALGLRGGEAIRPPQAALDGMPFRLTTSEGSSNPVFLGFATAPMHIEKEPNNTLQTAQRLPVPCEVTGTFAPAGDLDYYAFSATKGEKIVVEIFGERQSGLPDPFLAGFNAAGKRIFALDDAGRNIGRLRFTSNTRDPRWDFTVPATGEYFIQVRDLYHQQRGDVRFTYRLCIRKPQPDFRLIVVPAHDVQPDATVVGQGGKHWMDVLAFRQDGFEGPIRVEASHLPQGVTCAPVVIAPGKTSAPLVFQAAKDAPVGHAASQVLGKATIDDKEAVRYARGGGLTWPTVNTPGIARLGDSIVLAVRRSAPFSVTAVPARTELAAGEKLSIAVRVERALDWAESIQLSGFDLPDRTSVALASVSKGSTEAKVELTLPPNTRPGTYTFTINGAGQAPEDYARERDPKRPRGKNVRAVYPSNPITVTVLAGGQSKR
jgi:hypothetical protein